MHYQRNICSFLIIIVLLFLAGTNCNIKKNTSNQDYKQKQIALGKQLFFDNRLSYNGTKSCGSCHDPKFAFTDGYRKSITVSGDNVLHNSPSLINISVQHYFDWANPSVTSLEKQHERPLFNEQPPELGANKNKEAIIQKLSGDQFYNQSFKEIYGDEKVPVSFTTIIKSIAAFVESLQSLQSPYDSFVAGNNNAISVSAKKGMQLFFSEKLKCASCHTPPYFTMAAQTGNTDSIYFNIGLYNVLNTGLYPSFDNGLIMVTGKTADDGKYKTPSLRNVALTAPYMHDGSVSRIEEVIENYARGGRNIISGPYTGDGKNNRNKDKKIAGFSINAEEKQDLINFLYSLTDSTVLTNPAFQNPYH